MNGQLQYNRGLTEPRLPRSALAVRVTAVMLLCFLGWAWYFQLDEVTTGSGTVEPSGREQVVPVAGRRNSVSSRRQGWRYC